MTIDEAIKKEKERAKEIYMEAMLCHANPDDEKLDDCIEAGRYHERLVEWLEELKRRREYDGEIVGSGALNNAYNQGYDKTIDDFKRLCMEIIDKEKYCSRYDIDGIAKQLKAGGTDE